MGRNKTCPDCDEKVTADDAQCDICEDFVCNDCEEDHAMSEAFGDD